MYPHHPNGMISLQDGPGRDPHRKHRKHVQAQKLGELRVCKPTWFNTKNANNGISCMKDDKGNLFFIGVLS